jgi:photosystem II stability/assembly factor-like uncharacterized protein
LQTTNGGATWARVTVPPLPDVGSAEIMFADPQDGWAYDPDADLTNHQIYATHDGGRTWVPVVLSTSPERVQAVEAGDGTVWAVAISEATDRYSFFSSPVRQDAWTTAMLTLPLGAGPVPEAVVTLEDGRGWMLENDRSVIAAATLADGTWTDWSTPCTAQQGYGDAALADSNTQLFVLCTTNEFTALEASPTLFVSTDGGMTFEPLSGSLPTSMLDIAASPSGSLFCFDAQGIASSFDGGRTWQTVLGLASPPDGWLTPLPQLDFPSATVGYATTPAGDLVKTDDGGHAWLKVPVSIG